MFFHISTHFTATHGIPFSPPSLKHSSFGYRSGVEPTEFHNQLRMPPTHPLRPIIPTNACTFRITAAAGTELAGASSSCTLIMINYSSTTLVPGQQNVTTRRPSSFTRRRIVRLSSIANYSRLLPPVGVWAVSQSQCWRSISQSA